jgi:hypothetical protein
LGSAGRVGSIIVGIFALIVIVAIIIFLIQVLAPIIIGLIILAIIVGVGYWIYRTMKNTKLRMRKDQILSFRSSYFTLNQSATAALLPRLREVTPNPIRNGDLAEMRQFFLGLLFENRYSCI